MGSRRPVKGNRHIAGFSYICNIVIPNVYQKIIPLKLTKI